MTLEERVIEMEATAKGHDAIFSLIIAIGERQQTLLEENKRDSKQTQRLWVNLARK